MFFRCGFDSVRYNCFKLWIYRSHKYLPLRMYTMLHGSVARSVVAPNSNRKDANSSPILGIGAVVSWKKYHCLRERLWCPSLTKDCTLYQASCWCGRQTGSTQHQVHTKKKNVYIITVYMPLTFLDKKSMRSGYIYYTTLRVWVTDLLISLVFLFLDTGLVSIFIFRHGIIV